MKSLRQYISESQAREESPEPGDIFAFNWREEILIESRIVDVVEDGFVIEGNDQIMSLLEQCNCLTEDIARYGAASTSRGQGLSLGEESELIESHFAVGDRVQCRKSGMKGRVIKLDKEHGAEDDQYYTVKRDDGTLKKMAPEDMTKLDEQVMRLDHDRPEPDPGEYDYEGDMAKNELYTMIRSARKLIGMLDNNDNMPEWTQKKITKATDYADTAADYISSQKERGIMERFAEDPGKLDLTANPTKSQVFARYMSIYDYDGYAGEENEQEMQDLEDYAEQRFGPDTVNDMTSAGYYSYFGRADDPKKPIDQGSGNYTGLGRSPVSARDIKKSGTLNKRATAGTKDRILSRLGKHPKPALPESAEEKESNPVARATLHRIMMRHPGMLAQHGPERVMAAVDDVADLVGDMDNIGVNDILGWVNMVQEILDSQDQGVAEGSEDYQEIFQMNTFKQGKVGAVVQYKDKRFGFIYGTQLDPRKFDRAREAKQALNAHHNKQGVAEGSGKSLSVQQLATISDAALDQAYGYGRSTPGNTFGWQANLMSAAYAKKLIDAGVTDIEKISDAIHKGWNVTAQKFVQNPEQFDDTEKLRQAGKLDAKLQQRAKLMKINYAQLDNEEQEKDRVVARALLQAIKGQQGVAEGSLHEDLQADDGEHYRSADDFFSKFEADHFDDTQESEDGMEIRGYIDGVNVMVWRFNSPRKTSGYGVYDDSQLSEAEYQGRKVQLGKKMKGDVAKSKVYVRDPKTGNVKKVNFGDPNMKIRKSNPGARKSFRARHNCDNPGPKTKARYWSCRSW